MRISGNSDSLAALYALSRNTASVQSSLKMLSTGRRINTGADDPAGLIAANYLTSELASYEAQIASQQRTQSVATTADGAMGQISDMLTQVKSLQVANAGNTLSSDERAANQMQIDSLLTSVDRVASSSNFVGNKLLDGTAKLQSGNTTVTIPNMSSAHLGATVDTGTTYALSDLRTGGPLATANPELAGQVVSQAIQNVSTARGMVGALQTNHIQTTLANITNTSIQLAASRSEIVDTDYPTEFTNLMRYTFSYKANLLTLQKAHARTGTLLSILG